MNVLDQASGRDWTMYRADCVRGISGIPDKSVHLCIHSPPFGNLYVYSSSEADMGNSEDHAQFFEHYRYLIPQLLRVTIPGRLCVVHCKDLPLYRGRDGAMGLWDFPGELTRTFVECGWTFHSRVTIWKDPVTEMQRTKNHGLLYKELCKDSCGSRQGMADYLLVFRNWSGIGEGQSFPEPVTVGGERFGRYIGTDPPDPTAIADEHDLHRPTPDRWGRWPRNNPFPEGSEAYRQWSIKVWQKYASPVWFDIDQMNVLNYKKSKGASDERHICPLQLDVIERSVLLWSNPGDVVFSPFAGIGSELLGAVRHGRRGLGIELKDTYFRDACKTLVKFEKDRDQAKLFGPREAEPATA
jgi:DNA modification methylase